MKFLFVILAALIPSASFAALVDPALQNFLRQEGGRAKVVALMEIRTSRPLPNRDPRQVRRYLVEESKIAFDRLQSSLNAIGQNDIRVTNVFAVNFSFSAEVTPAGLKALAKVAGVTKIYNDGRISTVFPVSRRQVNRRFMESIPYDIREMALDQLWAQDPSIIGTGVMVGHIDTGVDGKHPALAGKIALYFDAASGQVTQPTDEGEHGTHTAGTIVGNPRDGVPMGVAPGARMISSGALSDYSDMLKAMDFMMDPDKNPNTADAPRLVSNSWNCEGAPDLEAFYRAIEAWEAAGILPVFSAGNSGPRAQSITKPHEHPSVLAVAATGPGGKIADFSSRGPGIFNGKKTQKPDASAPGVDIVSAVPGGRYEAMSGTSMAAPHAAGLATLLYQIEPSLTPAKIREVMVQSSDYVDPSGNPQGNMTWNANFGFGRLNALKAVNMVKNLRGIRKSQWGTMMSPAMDIMDGFKNLVGFDDDSTKAATSLQFSFNTDATRWIDGNTL